MSNGVSRRSALKWMAAGAVGSAACLSGAWFLRRRSTRPNFVVIINDDHRWDTLGCLGHPLALTPRMDALAAEGALLENHFATTSLCSPSRASMLTGLYTHRHGVRDNGKTGAFTNAVTYPQLLHEAGYRTAYIGKWHIGSARSQPGFDYWLSFPGQGDYFNPDLIEGDRRFSAQGYMTDLLGDHARSWITENAGHPFFLCLANKAAHHPFKPAARHRNLFEGMAIPEPVSWRDRLETKPVWQRAAVCRVWPDERPPGNYTGPVPEQTPDHTWNPEKVQSGWIDYYRVLCAADENVGRLLDELTTLDLEESTVVIVTGDNGLLRGEHKRLEKRCMYEESIRLPLIVRYPALIRPGARISAMTLNIDLASTILDLAGVSVPSNMQGSSMKRLLNDPMTPWRQSFLYEYFWEKGYTVPTTFGVRTVDWSFATYPGIGDIDELYDLKNDPLQMKNLATLPDYQGKIRELRSELVRLKQETSFGAAS